MFWPYAFISLSDHQPLNSRSSSLVHLDLAIFTSWAEQRWHAGKLLPDQEEGGSRILFKEARESDQCCVAAPRNTTRYTTRNTTHYTARNTTELLAGAAFWSFEAFKE